MPLLALDIQGYRSLRSVHLPLERLNVITGPNGSGKSNLYRALWLISQICEGDFARSICREGGLFSVMWAGPRANHKKPVRMSLGFQTDDLTFQISCGFPPLSQTAFGYDPQIKEEFVWHGKQRKPSSTLLDRSPGITWIRDSEGRRVEYPLILSENESILSNCASPTVSRSCSRSAKRSAAGVLSHVSDRRRLSDPKSASQRPHARAQSRRQRLAAALQTILEIGDRERLRPRSRRPCRDGRWSSWPTTTCPREIPSLYRVMVGLEAEGCARLVARELSDGTLRFLCLAASLLSPRPPSLIAVNEPESSLHPDLLPPLADLIVNAAKDSQIWISTHFLAVGGQHSIPFTARPIRLQLTNGETAIENDDEL